MVSRTIRILIADDSAVVRSVLKDAFASTPDLEIVAVARDGAEAIEQFDPDEIDVVILDVEMPNVDGIAAAADIRQRAPDVPIVMFSAHTDQGARATIDALSRGATTCVLKPRGTSLSESVAEVREDLGGTVRALVRRPAGMTLREARRALSSGTLTTQAVGDVVEPPPTQTPAVPVTIPTEPERRPRPDRIDVVAIGISTGGPRALVDLIPRLPATLPVPILIVQHMPEGFTAALADRLNELSPLRVHEAQGGESVERGDVWVAPGGRHLTVISVSGTPRLRLTEDPPENSSRPAVDVLFRSVAAVYGPRVLALVLTGMGSDGQLGAEVIREAGGRVVAQDEASSTVWGMPGSVVKAGLADVVAPLSRMSQVIISHARDGRPAPD